MVEKAWVGLQESVEPNAIKSAEFMAPSLCDRKQLGFAGGATSGTAVVTAIVITQVGLQSNITRDYGSVA